MAPVPDLPGGQPHHLGDTLAEFEEGHLVDATVLDPLKHDPLDLLARHQRRDDSGELVVRAVQDGFEFRLADEAFRQLVFLVVPVEVRPQGINWLFFFHLCSCSGSHGRHRACCRKA